METDNRPQYARWWPAVAGLPLPALVLLLGHQLREPEAIPDAILLSLGASLLGDGYRIVVLHRRRAPAA